MMQIIPEPPGEAIKNARQEEGIGIEKLAEMADITSRYLYRIENENKKPSYDVIYRLIHALGVSADRIFYPKDPRKQSEVEDLIRMLYDCDKRAFAVVKAMVRAMLETSGSSLDTN